jgi:hypothetical protein
MKNVDGVYLSLDGVHWDYVFFLEFVQTLLINCVSKMWNLILERGGTYANHWSWKVLDTLIY